MDNTSPPAPPAALESAAPATKGKVRAGRRDPRDTRGETALARTGTPWSDGRRRHTGVGASGTNRPGNLLLGPALIFPTAAEAALIHVFVPRFCSSEGPLCYLDLMVSMAFAQCFLMVPCKESGR